MSFFPTFWPLAAGSLCKIALFIYNVCYTTNLLTMSRNQWIAVAVALVVVGYVTGNVFFNGLSDQTNQSGTVIGSSTSSSSSMDATELQIVDTVIGTGAEAQPGKHVYVHYTGRFTNGQVFDTSMTRGVPIDFPLGTGYVIKGWDEGLKGMKVGGKRTITVPPSMGYGPNDYGPIPGNSTLIFDVELVDVK